MIEKKELYAALASARQEYKKFSVTGKGQRGPICSIEDIQEATDAALYKHDIGYFQHEVYDYRIDRRVLQTTIMHYKSGQFEVDRRVYSDMELPDQDKGKSQSFQRRYALEAVLGIPKVKDDDGVSQKTHFDQQAEPASGDQVEAIKQLLKQLPNAHASWNNIKKHNSVTKLEELTQEQATGVIGYLKKMD